MSITIIPRSKASTTRWSGGNTNEFYICPPGSSYKDRDFSLRISSATVDLAESDFTMLPAFDRIVLPLTGGYTLTYQEVPGRTDVLGPLQAAYFDGGWHTHSVGKAEDFNLIYRKGLKARYEKLAETTTLQAAPQRYLYVPGVPAQDLAGCTLGDIPLSPDTLYMIPEEEGPVPLALKNVAVVYLTVGQREVKKA